MQLLILTRTKEQILGCKMRSQINKLIILLTTVLWVQDGVNAAEITTNLYVSGTILPAPQWQDQNSNPITLISFSFDSTISGGASQDMDSDVFNLILSDTNNSGGSLNVSLLTPSGCTMGVTEIEDGDVFFIVNSSAYANGSLLTFTEGTTYATKVRFSGNGNYGSAAGLVTCSTTGTLTYTY